MVKFTPSNQLSTQCLIIEIVDDAFVEQTEELFITLSSSDDAVEFSNTSVVVSIADNDSKEYR